MPSLRNPLAIAGIGLLVLVLIVAGLILPPIALPQRLISRAGFTELTSDQPSVSLEQGLVVSVDPADLPPGFTVKLTALANGLFMNRDAGSQWVAARDRLPSYLTLMGPVFGLEISARSQLPAALTLIVNIPANAAPLETLDLYAWDGARWFFVPSMIEGATLAARIDPARLRSGAGPAALAAVQTRPAVPLTGTLLEAGQAFTPEAASVLNLVAPAALAPAPDGSLIGALAGGYQTDQSYAVTPLIRNHTGGPQAPDTGVLTAILTDPRLQAAHVQAVVDFAVGDGYDGVLLDYRGVDPVQRDVYTALVAELAAGLHGQQKTLAVLLPTPSFDGAAYVTGGYDWAEIGHAADGVLVPLHADPAAAGNGENERLLNWAVRLVNRYKIQLVTSSLGVDSPGAGQFATLDYPAALAQFGAATLPADIGEMAQDGEIGAELTGRVQSLDFDSQALAPRFTYLDAAGLEHTAWFGTADALVARLAPVQRLHLGGVTILDLLGGGNLPGMLNTMARYRANQAEAGAAPLTLIWTVSSGGAQIGQVVGTPGAPFIWPADQPGPYEIAAALHGPAQAGLGSVALTIEAASPTPTVGASPTPGPTATRGPTATPCPDCPTATPPPPTATSAPVVINPGASGPFELGGQVVHGGIAPAGDMKRAGMAWVKLQGYYGNDLSAAIANAHAQGFKILLSITDPAHASAPVTSPGYQQAFGQYLAGLAAQGADAIEVWNEPNIDREWPTGQVSGANYAQLLKTVYPMIKAANPGTMVISGAPAPTGFFGAAGCTERGCNDDVFLQQVTAAGGANYLDCVGIHYNSGTTSPSATTGSALSGYHYSFYFWPMISTYRSAFNNARQLCFTELGYLSGEGYSPDLASVAPSFGWAGGITVAQQAAWLGESAALSRDSGVVRMMIVFNVDFSGWGADPQGGYAIIRPGGGCPACDALDAVMP